VAERRIAVEQMIAASYPLAGAIAAFEQLNARRH
jgi:hypothetical protein